jgi:hypothetical protein
VKLLKPMNPQQLEELKVNLPAYCRTGVLIADLVNRLAGRDEVVKGIHRNPRQDNLSQIQVNFGKLMDYLKEFPRFCSRYLWSSQEMINGNEQIIWGFLDDIWHWSHSKISPFDPSRQIHAKPKKVFRAPLPKKQIASPSTTKTQTLAKQPEPELLKPRSIMPTNMIYEKKQSMSARNQFNTFGRQMSPLQ